MVRGSWWIWVTAGVAWGLLCVGVRHAALLAGMEMQELVARRSIEVARVQALERQVAEARRLESIERLAATRGFLKAPSGRIVIVAPAEKEGFLSRWFGSSGGDGADASESMRVSVRPREEVMTDKAPAKKAGRKSRKRAGKKKR